VTEAATSSPVPFPRLWTAMATPFAADGSLDEAGAERLAAWLTDQGTEGLVVAGSTGEGPTLSDGERSALVRAARRGARPGTPIYVGVGTSDTRRTVELSQRGEQDGADGLLLSAPPYNRPPAEGLVAHFTAAAGAVRLPVMLYNVPGRTAVTIDPDTVARVVAAAPNVVAVKEAGGRLDVFTRLRLVEPRPRYVLSGDDGLTLPAMAVGAHGVVSVAAHVAGPLLRALIADVLAGRREDAMRRHEALLPLVDELFRLSSPIPLKWALNRLGLPAGPPRLPLTPAPDAAMERLGRLLTDAVYQGA
jgi:4-hydroxy-tetrahydrodipicolinate synthase